MDTNRFTIKAQEAVVQARNLAIEQNHKEIYIEHFIMVLLNNENTAAKLILEKIGILTYKILEEIEYNLQFFPKTSGFLEDPKFSTDLRTLIEESIQEMNELNDNYLSGEHFLLALTNTLNLPVTSIFKKNGITKLRLIEAIREIRGQCADIHQNPEEQYEILKKYTRNLIDLARSEKLDPVICRDYEIDRLITILSRRTKNNPVLIGDAGVGKTAIVEGLAQRIYSRDVPQNLLDIQILSLDLGATVAGTRYRGEFEERITAILREITGNNEKYILFIDELHALVGAGAAEGSLDASTMLKPLLARGELRCIGATSVDDYRRYFEKDAGITRRFQPILVKEPNIEESIKILRILKKKYEKHHGIKINDNAIISAVKLSKRYISDRFLPDKAIDLIDEAASRYSANLDSMPLELNTLSRKISQLESEKSTLQVEDDSESILSLNKIEKEINIFNSELNFLRNQWEIERNILSKIKELRKNKEKNDKIITELIKELKLIQKDRKILRLSIEFEDIAQVISDWVKIPLSKLLEDEKSKLITMETKLQERVIGQNHVLRVISNAIRRARSGIQDPNRPIGSFIFMGPTGVGKTETAKALAEFLFNTDSSIIRIDMSEYMEKHSVARLIGAPPGYIGFDDGGYLTEAVRRKPYSIILLDEIEKANIEIFNILLQILDEGRLTDGKGRTVDFKNTVLILTSNIGSKIILEKKKISDEKSQIKIKELLKDYFKPEFLNRIDDTLVFNFLNKENVMDIADIQIKNLNKILHEKKIKIKFTEEGKKLLVDLGFNLQFGARELKRTIQNHIQDTLALSILNGEIKENNTILVDIDTTNRKFIFTKIE